jgi:hypothetical protein
VSNNTITELVLLSPATSARIDGLRHKFTLPPLRQEMITWLITEALAQLTARADEIRRNRNQHDPCMPGKVMQPVLTEPEELASCR